MKKKYVAPRAEIMTFNYSDNVTASGTQQGFTLREHIHGYTGCRETPTDNWFVGFVRESGCQQL